MIMNEPWQPQYLSILSDTQNLSLKLHDFTDPFDAEIIKRWINQADQQQLSPPMNISMHQYWFCNQSNLLSSIGIIIMKTALVILPACLLALAHLISAILLSTEAATDCEHIKNLSPQCKRAFQQGFSGGNQANAFCDGDCFGPVLSAYERVHLISKLQLTMCRD